MQKVKSESEDIKVRRVDVFRGVPVRYDLDGRDYVILLTKWLLITVYISGTTRNGHGIEKNKTKTNRIPLLKDSTFQKGEKSMGKKKK